VFASEQVLSVKCAVLCNEILSVQGRIMKDAIYAVKNKSPGLIPFHAGADASSTSSEYI
jgi:hypothetical protein